ncbi:hypothetical protein GGF38_002733, partial [Coemansia sp. RSA 25]
RQKALLDGSGGGGGSATKSKKNKQQQQHQSQDPPLTPSQPQAPPALVLGGGGGGDDQHSVADDDEHDDDGDSAAAKKRKKNKKKNKKKAKGKSATTTAAAAPSSFSKNQTPSAPGHPHAADAASAAEDEDDGEDDEDGAYAYADADDLQRGDPQNPFDSLAWISPSESSTKPQQSAALRNGADTGSNKAVPPPPPPPPAAAAAAAPVVVPQPQPALQIQTQHPRNTLLPTATSGGIDDSQAANKAARSRRGTNAARYVPGVGFVSEDGVNATSPQLVASATSAAAAVAAAAAAAGGGGSSPAGALRGVQAGSVVRAPVASGRMSPMSSVVRMGSPAPRSQSPLVMSATTTASDRRPLDKDALSRLQASLSAGPTENIERSLTGLAHDNLVSLATTAIIERRRTVDSAVEWNKAVDKVLHTYDLIAAQIGSLKTLCESHDSETARLEELLKQSTQESMKWQEHCCRLSAELEALKLGGGDPRVSAASVPGSADPSSLAAVANGSMWSMSEQPSMSVVESSPWAAATSSIFGSQQQSSGYYSQQQQQQQQSYAGASNVFGHFSGGGGGGGTAAAPNLLPPGGYMASASSYAAAVAAIQAQALAQHQQQQQQQRQPMFADQQPLGNDSSAALGNAGNSASSLLTALNARSQAF